MLICFIGVDGSGKTTYASRLCRELNACGASTAMIHYDSMFAYRFHSVSNKASHTSAKIRNKESRGNTQRSMTSAAKKKIYQNALFVDDLLFYLFRLRYRNRILVCDRYFYDTAISRIFLGGRESKISAVYQKIFPLPDLLVLMDVDPETAHFRKPEESPAYLNRMRTLYLRLYHPLQCNKMQINSSEQFDRSFAALKDTVLELWGRSHQ